MEKDSSSTTPPHKGDGEGVEEVTSNKTTSLPTQEASSSSSLKVHTDASDAKPVKSSDIETILPSGETHGKEKEKPLVRSDSATSSCASSSTTASSKLSLPLGPSGTSASHRKATTTTTTTGKGSGKEIPSPKGHTSSCAAPSTGNTHNNNNNNSSNSNNNSGKSAKWREISPKTGTELMDHLEGLKMALESLMFGSPRNGTVTEREVVKLRNAYDVLVSDILPAQRPQIAIECGKLLDDVEQLTGRSQAAKSFGDTANDSWHFLKIPLQRRLQTLVVSIFLFFTFIPFSVFLSIVLLMYRSTMPFMIAYFVYIFTIGKPKFPVKKNMWYARLKLWRYYRDYFPIRLVIPKPTREEFDPSKNYLFVYHPHGIHTFGAIVNFGTDANHVSTMLPGLKLHLQTLRVNFFIPFWRQVMMPFGVGDASARSINNTLRAGPGESVVLVVGGAEESLMAKPNTNDLTLQKRRGFVRIALENGASLVPVYGFGETNVYEISDIADRPAVKKILNAVKRYIGFVIPMIRGRGYFNYGYGVLPHRRPIVVVVGSPIHLPRVSKPSAEEIDKWHVVYTNALTKLFEENKSLFDLESTGLRIVV